MASRDDEKNPYKPFQSSPVEPKFPRDRGFTVQHTRLDLTLDEKARTVAGTATLTVRPIHKISQVELDADDVKIRSVKVDGASASFQVNEPSLVVKLPRAAPEGKEFKVRIQYEGKPRRGLYFIAPDKQYPKKPYQIWSQGESEDNHHWFPGYDYPNNKATSEALFRVRKPLVAFSNGHLVDTKADGGWATYHWKQDVPQPNYLIAVVVGNFDEVKDTWQGVPLHYFVPKGMKEWAKETFKRTGNILEFFSKATGYRYPYPKYAQAVIADFMWGGMENTSMTTVNERFLILPEHREDADPDGLIAHEAAHQWFGDLVTTKSWDHIWLNEGFATYFDALWHESFHGADLFQLELLDNAEAYFTEDRDHYRRPIVTRDFAENEDLFDRHTYQKGSLVLHMLRHELGDDLWWKSIKHYLKKFEWKNVETSDFKIAIEEATGRSLDWFFDQWIYKAGHPELEVSSDYDDKSKMVKVGIKQTQKVVGDTPLFRIPLTIWLWTDAKQRKEHSIQVTKANEAFFLPSAKKPALVQLDPHGTILKRVKFDRSARDLAFQLEHAPDVAARIEACQNLGKKASDPVATEALGKALVHDKFWGVRRAAALALGDQATIAARTALEAHTRDPHPRVRRGVSRALGNFKQDPKAAAIIQRILRAEKKSDYVVAAAVFGLAQTRDKSAFSTIKPFLGRSAHNEIIRTSTLAGLAELRDARALPLVQERTRYGEHPYVRGAATSALARLWDYVEKKDRDEIRETLIRLFKDEAQQERRSAYAAGSEIADAAIAGALAKQVDSEPIGLLRKVARDSLRDLHEKLGQQAEIGDLKKHFQSLTEEQKKLTAKVAELEAKFKAQKKGGGKKA